jgi:hypothetical protein
MPIRTANECAADEFDMDLYRLVRRADELAGNMRDPYWMRWSEVAMALTNARPKVRAMMSKIDVERTA